ncbi:MAG: hypothetical protein Q8Q59_16365 [Luteolibacter sp.]|jgi:hypothetical protein|nr:hypothetical protein [Luteolibacter sp.]
MKWIAAFKFALEIGRFTCCLMGAAGLLRAESESLPYHLIRFEENEGYQAGAFKGSGGGLQLLQGEARIVREDRDEAGQCLETVAGDPYASIHFHGERVSRNDKTYYEVWVRPCASPLAKSEEFMDLDGAVLGFFAYGPDGHATFHAYHALPEDAGYWVSTGVSAAVGSSGMTQEWIRIGICQNMATGTWDLEIGGEVVLSEIRPTETSREDGIQLWLLGHETGATRFDDLLVSPVDPDSLRLGETKHLPQGRSARNGHAGNLDRTGERKVGRKQSDDDRRRHDAGIPAGLAKAAPKSLEFEMDIIGGGTQHGKFDGKGADANRSFLLYTPQYDDAGKPLPLKVRIQCDAELAEGVDLSKILWAVTELAKKEDKEPLRVIAHGTFTTGFTQIAEIPSEWANKGTQMRVGTNLMLRKSP